jgi:hypothetical protein
MLVLAHGAGAGMRHPFLERTTEALNRHGLAVYRFQFPYLERGTKRPDSPTVLTTTIRAAVETAGEIGAGLPLFAGGKSMGGRMTSLAAAEAPLPGVRGIFFLGFPLHAPRKPDVRRADHLRSIDVPLLFIQGTRDSMAPLATLQPIVGNLGSKATMHVVEGGDHSFATRKRDRPETAPSIHDELARVLAGWVATLCPGHATDRAPLLAPPRPDREVSVPELGPPEP